MRIQHTWSAALVGLTTLSAFAQTATIELDHTAYLPGEAIVADFAGGPGNTKDWIGVYPEGVTPGSQNSTIWRYVDGTTSGNAGLTDGSVTFPTGLGFSGPWTAFLLLNDGYDVGAQVTFTVVESTSPVVRRDKKSYAPGEAISMTFTNGPASAKDWIGVYPEGVTPGAVNSTIWSYVDGTQSGNTGLADGTIQFTSGLSTVGRYVAYLLSNDTYDILASEPIVVKAAVNAPPRVIGIDPADGSTNGTPTLRFSATVLPGSGQVTGATVQLLVDGTAVTPTVDVQADRSVVRYNGSTLYAAGSTHALRLIAGNTTGLKITNDVNYVVGSYSNLVLPAPIHLETFDAVAEGSLPVGWTAKTYTEVQNEDVDFGNLDSAAYKGWTVVEASRFAGTFQTYSNPETPAGEASDYQRVLRVGPWIVANGAPVTQLASGRFLFGNSGYRRGQSQVMFIETVDFNLTGKNNIHVGFNALWEQNQDSFGAVEYSIDGGASWLPVVYYLVGGDIVKTEAGEVDAEATLTAPLGDVARYFDDVGAEQGGFYGAFIGAPVTAALAPYIEARTDDSATDGKRIEVRRLPAADGQSRVRLRFAHAGTDSWYFGLDNVGFYSIASAPAEQPMVSAVMEAGGLRLTWPASATGFVLEQRAEVATGGWTAVAGVSGNSALVPVSGDRQWFRLRQP
jgi:hypothetical protein